MDSLGLLKKFVTSKAFREGLTARKDKFGLETLEERVVMNADFRSIDGTGNNLDNPDWGSTGVELLRIAEAAYADGVSAPAGADRPSAREISNEVVAQGDVDLVSDRFLSAMIFAWGQFLDHDLDLTTTGSTESFNITVPTGDPFFDPSGTGTQTIPLSRSNFDPATGTDSSNPREQVNLLTAWLDGSQIYGADEATAYSLRTLEGGRLKTSDGDLLPLNAESPGVTFVAGDVRVNENIELVAMHTLFVREHNRIADQISQAAPGLDDETIYQLARERVIAELQVITYKEFLPALLGKGALDRYEGYDPTVNPGIANEFSTAAFRIGHTLLADSVGFLDNDGNPIASEITLAEAFFNSGLVQEHGIDPLLKFLSSESSQEVDSKIVDSVRNFLFGPPGAGGLDLASLNIQRGRDHGLADYNSIREAYGLPRVTDFADITSNVELQQKLEALYGSVDNIDAWVGALAEDHVKGSSTGELLRAVISDQFERIRDGDRFWYQNIFSGETLRELENTTLSDIIQRNTSLTNVQDNVFFFKLEISGTVFNDANQNSHEDRKESGVAGQTVSLVDAGTGLTVASTTTNNRGEYRFDVSDGLALGSYLIRVSTPQGWAQTTANPPTITITRGDVKVRDVDVGLAKARPQQQPPKHDHHHSHDHDRNRQPPRQQTGGHSQSGRNLDAMAIDWLLSESNLHGGKRR